MKQTWNIQPHGKGTEDFSHWAVVVAQLVERSLLTPKTCGSNPVMGKCYFLSNCVKSVLKRQKLREKEAGNGPFIKKDGTTRIFL